MTHVAANQAAARPPYQVHSAATVFTQNPETSHILAVPFDGRMRPICLYPGNFKPLTFRHIRIAKTQNIYSAVLANADCQHIGARGSPHWMPQLLPRIYDDQTYSTRQQAGLIGSLPLLIALAASSAPPSFLESVLTSCVQPGKWKPHEHQYPAGRKLRKSVSIPS